MMAFGNDADGTVSNTLSMMRYLHSERYPLQVCLMMARVEARIQNLDAEGAFDQRRIAAYRECLDMCNDEVSVSIAAT